MMDYNYNYPVQAGPPPLPPPAMMNNQPDCSMMSGSMTPSSIMHSSPAPSTPQSMRHTPGPPPMQQHHPSMGHQQQPSPHPNYHQLPSHPPISHSASPHPSSTPLSHGQPPPRPATGPSPLHHQMPPHINGQSPKIAPPGPMPVQSQPSNLMPPGVHMHPSTMTGSNHHHNHRIHHSSGPPPQQPPPGYPINQMPPHGGHHYGQPPMNHQPQLAPPPMNHGPPSMPNGQMMGGGPPPPPSYMPTHPGNQERGSPFYPHIPQTEMKIIELNKRLQSRPHPSYPNTPLPGSSEESDWWERFACDFFDNDAILTLRIPNESKPIEYTIGRTLIPRFFKSYYDGGVTDLSTKLRNTRENRRHPNLTTLECDQADIITKNIFRHPTTGMGMYVVVHTEGHLSLEFANNGFDNLVIKSWRFHVNQCHEYIDRSMTNGNFSYLNEPVTRFGLTKSTCAYLKMCLVMEPMQDLMSYYKHTNLDPRSCLKNLLLERYGHKSEDKSAVPAKKRRRKNQGEAGAATNKKSRAAANMIGNANAMNNNVGLMADADPGMPNLSLASQDVLTVGEPSMLGADFGDENERRITRLENTQYDSSTEQQGVQQTSILNENSQMNQICMSNTDLNQDEQGDMSNHLAQDNGAHNPNDTNVQTMLGYPPNGDHTDDSINNQGGVVENELSESSHDNISHNNNNNNNNGNCLQGNNDLTSAGDTNHQMNSYAMNGETNHIKSEMDINQTKQSMQANPIAESEAR